MPWMQEAIGGESGGMRWFNNDTQEISYTDPQIAIDAGIAALMSALTGGKSNGFGSSPPSGWRWEPGQVAGESMSPGRWRVSLPGYTDEIGIDPYLGRETTWDSAFGDNPEHPDNALGFMIMSGYDQDLIRALIRSNPTAFNKIGIIEKDLPYWLEKARKQEEIGQAINAREASDPLGMAGLALIGGLSGAALSGLLGGVEAGATGAFDQFGSLANLTGNSGQTIFGTQGIFNGAGGIASELVGADAIETMINLSEATGGAPWSETARQLGFNNVESLLSSINPAWGQTVSEFLKNNPGSNVDDIQRLSENTQNQVEDGDLEDDTDVDDDGDLEDDVDGDGDGKQVQTTDKDISDVLDEDDILDALDKYFKGTGGGTDWGKLLAGLIGGKQTSDIADKFLARDRETRDRDLARRQPWYDTANQQRGDAWGWMKSNWGPMTDELMRRSAANMSYKGFNQSGTGAANMTNQVLGGLLPQFNDNYKLNLNAAGLMGDPNAAMKEANDLFKTGMGLQQQANQNYGFAAREATSGILGGIRGDMGETISNIIKEYGLT